MIRIILIVLLITGCTVIWLQESKDVVIDINVEPDHGLIDIVSGVTNIKKGD